MLVLQSDFGNCTCKFSTCPKIELKPTCKISSFQIILVLGSSLRDSGTKKINNGRGAWWNEKRACWT